MIYNRIKNVLKRFAFQGEYQDVQELSSGNVNQTYHLYYDDEGKSYQYILQRINGYVFKEPKNVMDNIVRVTEHLRRTLEECGVSANGRVLDIIKTWDNQPLYMDPMGGFWRAYTYIENAIAPDTVESLDMMREVGRGFGNFQRLLVDFPAQELYVPIPNFHNTTKRFYAFVRAVDEDKAGRVKKVQDEIEFFFDRRRMMNQIVQLLDNGTLPLRVTHNDTKSNNVMIDLTTGKAVCVIDLDTVMPGSSLYDYGDAVRFGASTAAEDEPDTSKIALDMEKTRAFTEGFIQETDGFLTEAELRLLPLGIKVITCELAMRFLTDYIDGDLYFRVKSPKHNLIRARAQIALLKDIESKQEELDAMIDDLLRKGKA